MFYLDFDSLKDIKLAEQLIQSNDDGELIYDNPTLGKCSVKKEKYLNRVLVRVYGESNIPTTICILSNVKYIKNTRCKYIAIYEE